MVGCIVPLGMGGKGFGREACLEGVYGFVCWRCLLFGLGSTPEGEMSCGLTLWQASYYLTLRRVMGKEGGGDST